VRTDFFEKFLCFLKIFLILPDFVKINEDFLMHLTDTLAYTYSMGLHFVDIFQQGYHLHLYLIVKLSDGLKDFILLQLLFMSQLIVLNVLHEFALLGFLLELLQTSEMVFYEILSHRNDLLALSLDELVVNTLQVVQHKSFVLKLLLLR
jgi:hypothetical protein